MGDTTPGIDEQIESILRNGQNRPANIADETEYSYHYVVKRLNENDKITKVADGIYALKTQQGLSTDAADNVEKAILKTRRLRMEVVKDNWQQRQFVDWCETIEELLQNSIDRDV